MLNDTLISNLNLFYMNTCIYLEFKEILSYEFMSINIVPLNFIDGHF
jgi:hypothetical protein